MKKIWKTIVMIFLILTMVLSGTVIAFGENVNGINVQLNGKNIAFTNAVPKNVNGSTMVPLRQMLETLGATVTYEAKTKTVTANTTGKVISFVVGTTDVVIDENGLKTTKKMNIAPFIDRATQKTYVPIRFFAENLGYKVGWDAIRKTVVVIDPETLFANADEDFSIISKLLKSDLDPEKSYAVNGKFNADITDLNPESATRNLDLSITGNYTGIQQKSNADLVMNMTVNFDRMMNTLPPEDREFMLLLLDPYKNILINMKLDGDAGIAYMKSNMFSAIDPVMGESAWYRMNVYEPYEEMGVDIRALNGIGYSNVGIGELLTAGLSLQSELDTYTYQDIKVTYALLKNLIGDEAFQTTTTGDTGTHTLKINSASLIAAIAQTAFSEGVSGDLDFNELKELSAMNAEATLLIREKSRTLDFYDLKGSGSLEGSRVSFNFSGDQRNATGQMTLDMQDLLKMVINLNSSMKETSKTPDVNPPAGAKIVEYPAY